MPDFNPAPKPLPPPKKKPQPLKRTPLKRKPYTFKKPKPIAKVSEKQATKLKAYKAAKLVKAENEMICCQACGNPNICTPSHLIPQGKSDLHRANVKNIHWHCQYPCHDNCESGRFWMMLDGLSILEFLWQNEGVGRQRFWKFWHDHEENRDLWQMSSFYDSEIHI